MCPNAIYMLIVVPQFGPETHLNSVTGEIIMEIVSPYKYALHSPETANLWHKAFSQVNIYNNDSEKDSDNDNNFIVMNYVGKMILLRAKLDVSASNERIYLRLLIWN